MLGWIKLEHTTYFPIMYWADRGNNMITTLSQTAAFKPPSSFRFKDIPFKASKEIITYIHELWVQLQYNINAFTLCSDSWNS